MALADSDVVKTILGQFKIKVDDLKRQIESEAKRGEKPFEGEIGVSPRVKDALSRAFVASNELSHSYVGPEHFLIGLAEEGEGLAANLLRRYGLTPQALRQQVSKVVGKGAEDGRAEAPTNTPELDKYSRDLTKMARDGKLDPESVDEETLPRYLDTCVLPDPDLVIRTSGEARVSNFLLWQSAYAEYEFIDTLWPDFTREEFGRLVGAYGKRERRFGAVKV